ncbi:MAG: extracellular solute-binding protein, partial [Acinetobacter sp.]
MRKKILAISLCTVLAASSIVGCSGGAAKTADSAKTTAAEKTEAAVKTEAATTAAVQPTDPKQTGLSSIFPLKDPVTLTYYIKANGAMSATMETYADVEFFKELEKLTNVHIEWNHNTTNENFALMIAGGDLPDMINWNLNNAAGGPQALLEDGVILDLTELLPQHAPNYSAWLAANPEEDKAFKLDDGTRFQFCNFNANWDTMDITNFKILGPQIRKDWLDDLGLKMPTNTDELYEVLTAFKTADCNKNGDPNDEIPYVITGSEKGLNETMYSLAGSFGAINDFQIEDGKVIFGSISDNFKQFLTYMNKLYAEGLINSDFAVNQQAFDQVLQGQGGFSINSMGSGVIVAHELLKSQNANYNYVSV